MALFTLCSNYVDHCCSNNEDFLDILLSFCQTNDRKIALDEKDRIIESYRTNVANKENFNTWLKLLTMKKNNFEIVNVNLNDEDIENFELMISVSSQTYDKTLACKSKSDYLSLRETIEKEKINLLDKDELKQNFATKQETTIIRTSGDNSPIIDGNQNKVR